jgi:hypothetical protein
MQMQFHSRSSLKSSIVFVVRKNNISFQTPMKKRTPGGEFANESMVYIYNLLALVDNSEL